MAEGESALLDLLEGRARLRADRVLKAIGLPDLRGQDVVTMPVADFRNAVLASYGFGSTAALAKISGRRHCSVCGCTEDRACADGDQGCGWAGPALCTACMPDDGPLILDRRPLVKGGENAL